MDENESDMDEDDRSNDMTIDGPTDVNRQPNLLRVPNMIRPPLSIFRVEVRC